VSRGIPPGTEDNTTQARMEQSFTHETLTFSAEGFGSQSRYLAPRQPSLQPEGEAITLLFRRKRTRKNNLRYCPRRAPSDQQTNFSNQKQLGTVAIIATVSCSPSEEERSTKSYQSARKLRAPLSVFRGSFQLARNFSS
jgi:hypothetical protein